MHELESKIKSGNITIRDIEPRIHSEGLARSNGYVLFPLREILQMIAEYERMWKGAKNALKAFPNGQSTLRRLYRTRKIINEFIESVGKENFNIREKMKSEGKWK